MSPTPSTSRSPRWRDHLADLPADRVILVVCRSGRRSASAATLLTGRGLRAVNVSGGMIAWEASGLPIVTSGPSPVTVHRVPPASDHRHPRRGRGHHHRGRSMIVIVILGLFIGLLLGLLGGGGSILAVPALVYGAAIPLSAAIPTSLIVVGLSSAIAVLPRLRQVRWRLAMVFAGAGAAAAFAGRCRQPVAGPHHGAARVRCADGDLGRPDAPSTGRGRRCVLPAHRRHQLAQLSSQGDRRRARSSAS